VGQDYESDGTEFDVLIPIPHKSPITTEDISLLKKISNWILRDYNLRARLLNILIKPRHRLVERLFLGELDPGLRDVCADRKPVLDVREEVHLVGDGELFEDVF
jgi:hypothetical protein